MSRRHLAIIAVMIHLSGALLVAHAPSAAAAVDATCADGDMCLYNDDWYSGCRFTFEQSVTVLSVWNWANCGGSPSNAVNSYQNRGVFCSATLYDWNSYSGGFRFVSRVGLGGNWADGNLSNNVWGGQVAGSSGTVMENDLQSYRFC